MRSWAADFPGVHYMSRGDHELREKLQVTNTDTLFYSDRGAVLDEKTDIFYDCLVNADYILSLPALKGHQGGGITFFEKNHFGSNTRESASHLHKGIHKGTSAPLRGEYRLYRVFVDLMAYENLGGKNLIYIGDFLWSTSHEHYPPSKFRSAPFNNDWSSSILVSMDPVAISSVGLDILQEEFQLEDMSTIPPRRTFVRFSAVDDYLHQAASSDWWPEGYTYDPEKDRTPIPSLGVHEHWNNASDRLYSRNLGTGEGIDLKYINTSITSVPDRQIKEIQIAAPNPFSRTTRFSRPEQVSGSSTLNIYSTNGELLASYSFAEGDQVIWDGTDASSSPLPDGLYLYSVHDKLSGASFSGKVVKKE